MARSSWYCGDGAFVSGAIKSFPVQSNEYYLTVMRYIESNPLRAELVKSSTDWQWSGLAIRQRKEKDGLLLSAGPMSLPENWLDLDDRLKEVEKQLAEKKL